MRDLLKHQDWDEKTCNCTPHSFHGNMLFGGRHGTWGRCSNLSHLAYRSTSHLRLCCTPFFLCSCCTEPTSGLSSTDSVTVVNCLRNFADRSNTLVVCVIHQPRNSVFQLFDNLLLLSSEGQCVYQGEVDSVLDYFEKMGTPIPPFENPPGRLLREPHPNRELVCPSTRSPFADTSHFYGALLRGSYVAPTSSLSLRRLFAGCRYDAYDRRI